MEEHPPKALSETNLTTSLDKICLRTLLGNYIISTFWQAKDVFEKWKPCASYIVFLKSVSRLDLIEIVAVRNMADPPSYIIFSQPNVITEIRQRLMESKDYTHTKVALQEWRHVYIKPDVKVCSVTGYDDICQYSGVCINVRSWLTVRLPVLTQADWVGDGSALCWQRSPFVTILSREMGRQAPVGPESSCLPLCNPILSMYRHVYGPQEHPSRGN